MQAGFVPKQVTEYLAALPSTEPFSSEEFDFFADAPIVESETDEWAEVWEPVAS